MAMAVDSQRHHLGGSMGFDNHMHYSGQPQWHNPWAQNGAVATTGPGYNPSLATSGVYKAEPAFTKPASVPMPAYPTAAPTSTPMGFQNSQFSHPEAHDAVSAARAYESNYVPAPAHPPVNYTSSSPSNYGMGSYGSSIQASRRLSQGLGALPPPSNFGGPLDNARAMILNQDDVTPRNIYGGHDDRSTSADYGFPAQQSHHSSISSASSSYPYHYASSVDSATDYSSCNESVSSFTDRTLPRPNGFVMNNMPPAPATMMGSFNSKISSSAQKKHKCKVCDKRFTRPSSLQTHMYSHTGEKPFQCEVPGCGRNFSVVSNLRRHRKVHKGEIGSTTNSNSNDEQDHDSPAESWSSSRKNSV